MHWNTPKIQDPVSFLKESRRVCGVGGKVLAVHADWDTIVFTSRDEERGRRILRKYCDMGPAGWTGRNLPGLMRRAGFSSVECQASVILEREYQEGTHGRYLANVIREWLEIDGSIPITEIHGWLSELEELEEAGAYLFSVNRYVCIGRV